MGWKSPPPPAKKRASPVMHNSPGRDKVALKLSTYLAKSFGEGSRTGPTATPRDRQNRLTEGRLAARNMVAAAHHRGSIKKKRAAAKKRSRP